MSFPTTALVVVHLMTTLCAITLSEEIPLTCPDTARRELKDISEIYNCKPSFIPEEKAAICDGVVSVGMNRVISNVTLAFKMIEEVPESTAVCLGLQNVFVNISEWKEVYDTYTLMMSYSIDFNPLLPVGVLTDDRNTSKSNRSCSISLLSDVLNLEILRIFDTRDLSFWNFSSPLLGTQSNWIQSLYVYTFNVYANKPSLERLQNTSIRFLNMSGIFFDGTILINDMPFLREMVFHQAPVDAFHQDSFLGMPEMEVLILQETRLQGIPQMIDRMPKLKILEIVYYDSQKSINFTIPTRELSTLKNLQILNLKNNMIHTISEKLPPFSQLRILNLDSCGLSSIEENDFLGFPVLEELTISNNNLTHLKENVFRPLQNLKLLDLSFNRLTNWPVLYDLSLIFLDMSGNLLSNVYNLGITRTTVEILSISHNRILRWDDKYVFSLPKSLTSDDNPRSKVNMSYSENSSKKNAFTSASAKATYFSKMLGLSTTQIAELSTLSYSGSQRKLFHRIPANLSLLKSYEQTQLSKTDNGENIIVNNFENTIEYSSLMKSNFWVKRINISNNLISGLSETMMQSLDGIHEVDLGGNEFDCVDCRMIPFQKWLNTTSTTVRNLGTSDPLLCSSPVGQRGTPVNLVQFDEEPCLEKIRTTSLLMLIGVPVGLMSMLVVAAAVGLYNFRLEISYMLYLYKIRQRAQAFSQSVFNKLAFDAFICYSSKDRRFVLTQLVPPLEKGQERYCLCLHERDFPLGSHIVTNIVGSIQHSRKTIIVLSEHFVNSKWCNWELEMASHKMLIEDEHFLILIQLEKMDRNKLPRHIRFMMDTRTYLEWQTPGHDDDEVEVVERLKKALGPSIFQTTNERAPLLSDVMEEY